MGRLESGRGREGWGGRERKRKREAAGKVGLRYLGLECFLLYLFLDSIKPVRFGPVQSVLSFFKPEPNQTG